MKRASSTVVGRAARLALLGSALLAGPSARGDNVVIGVIGDFGAAWDGGVGYKSELAVSKLVKSWRPDFILTVGDNNYPTNAAETMDLNIGQFYHDFIHPYQGAFGNGAASNRFYPTLGNHDWALDLHGSNAIKPYLDYFTLPGNERYYTYRYANLEVFAVDSDPLEPDGVTAASTQALWLSNALATSTATWRLVFFHQPPFSSGYWHGTYTGESTNMNWPFQKWGADAVLCGHDHLYERIHTNGLPYFVVGTGGDRLDSFRLPLTAGSRARYNTSHGALRIDATETNLVFRFYSIGNVVVDACRLGVRPDRPKPARQAGS
jgi:tartrate-resistant acid phosphatase type 5